MPRVRFLEQCAGRQRGDEENNPDAVLCANWAAKGVVEILDEPRRVEDTAIRSPMTTATAPRKRAAKKRTSKRK